MSMKSKLKKFTTAVMTATLGVSLIATSAFAASLPDFSEGETGSITVCKYQTDGNYTGVEGTGKATDVDNIDTTKASPLANVTFTTFKVGGTEAIGTTPSVYDESLLTQDEDANKWSYNSVVETESKTTGADGKVSFSNLELGRYLVVETNAPASVTEKTAPFFVDVPMTDPENRDNWMYDIYVFPKNVVKYDSPEVDKSITSDGNKHETASTGDELTWIIKSKNPTNIADYTKYIISDTLDSKLELVGTPEVKRGTAYNSAEVVNTANYTNSSSTGSISIQFKPEYLKTLTIDPDMGDEYFYVTYKTKVINAKFDEDGNAEAITNGANVEYDYVNKPDEDLGKVSIPDDSKPEVHSGGLKFKKVNSTGTALSGAEFKIATSEANAKAGVFMKDANGVDIVSTSASDTGYVSFTGLAYGQSGQGVTEGSTTYWVVETKAPDGYQLLTALQSFEVSYSSYTDTHAGDTTLVNISEFGLPSTGSVGTIVFVLAGIAVLALAGVSIARKKREA